MTCRSIVIPRVHMRIEVYSVFVCACVAFVYAACSMINEVKVSHVFLDFGFAK